MNQELFVCPSFTDKDGELHGNFSHIKHLYNLELGKPIKMAYKLCDKVLNLASIEKTNASLADACVHESPYKH